MKNYTILFITLSILSGYSSSAQDGIKLDVNGVNYSTGRMINFEITTTLGPSADLLQLIVPSNSEGQFIEFERGSNNIVGRIHATGNVEFKNALFDGDENTGTNAALEIRSGSQVMLLDGNEIDGMSTGLHLNYNSQENINLRTATNHTEINMEHENGSGASGNGVTIIHPGSNNEYWTFYVTNSDGNLEIYNQGSLKGEFDDTSGTYSSVSDRRLKQNIKDCKEILPRINLLDPKVYTFINDKSGKEYFGFIAQEVEKVFPNLVTKGKGDTDSDSYTMDYSSFGVLAIAAIKEMQTALHEKEDHVANLEAKIAALEAAVAQYVDLEERLTALEKNK